MSVGYVLDEHLLRAYAFGDVGVGNLLAVLTDREIRLAVPALALSSALVGLSDPQRDELIGVIENNTALSISQLATVDEVMDLADTRTVADEPVDLTSAHTVAVARHLDWPIVTTDRTRWAELERAWPFRLYIVEFAEGD